MGFLRKRVTGQDPQRAGFCVALIGLETRTLSAPQYLRSSSLLYVCPFVFHLVLVENSTCLAVQRETMFFCAW